MIAMGEELSVDMALRSMRHLLQYGEPVIRRAVPVALALLCVSNPNLGVLDMLSKLSHDADPEVAYNAILGMGILGAGTNQARVAAMLRHLALYYSKDPDTLFVVRIAQVRSGRQHDGWLLDMSMSACLLELLDFACAGLLCDGLTGFAAGAAVHR